MMKKTYNSPLIDVYQMNVDVITTSTVTPQVEGIGDFATWIDLL